MSNLNPRLAHEAIQCAKCGRRVQVKDLNRHRKECMNADKHAG